MQTPEGQPCLQSSKSYLHGAHIRPDGNVLIILPTSPQPSTELRSQRGNSSQEWDRWWTTFAPQHKIYTGQDWHTHTGTHVRNNTNAKCPLYAEHASSTESTCLSAPMNTSSGQREHKIIQSMIVTCCHKATRFSKKKK